MSVSTVLVIDAVVNFVLGILLLLLVPFPGLNQFLGVPIVEVAFYPSIMGGVFVGIGLSLLIEVRRRAQDDLVGLGLGGAVAINLCGGSVLMGWLVFGGLDLPVRGLVFLWILAVLLVGISILELVIAGRE